MGSAQVVQLQTHETWLLKTLACFKPPSSASRAALNSPHVIVGDHRLEIKSGWKDLALAVSDHLVRAQPICWSSACMCFWSPTDGVGQVFDFAAGCSGAG